MGFDAFLIHYGLLAIFILLLLKSAGIPIPIPTDVILLATATGAAQGRFILWQASTTAFLAVVLGGLLGFLLARGPGRTVLLRFGRYLGLTPTRLAAVSTRVEKAGIVGMSITILIPGLRGIAITAAGLTGIPSRIFVPGLVIGSTLFLGIHFLLAYLGSSLLGIVGNLLPSSPKLIIVILLLLLSFTLWLFAFSRQKAAKRDVNATLLETLHEGICPVCQALSVVGAHSLLSTEKPRIDVQSSL